MKPEAAKKLAYLQAKHVADTYEPPTEVFESGNVDGGWIVEVQLPGDAGFINIEIVVGPVDEEVKLEDLVVDPKFQRPLDEEKLKYWMGDDAEA